MTEAALDDLIAIGWNIGINDPARAETFVDELYDRCQRLAAQPLAFPLLPNWEHKGIRRRSYGNYLIFYRVKSDTVEILHILHGARDYETIIFPAD